MQRYMETKVKCYLVPTNPCANGRLAPAGTHSDFGCVTLHTMPSQIYAENSAQEGRPFEQMLDKRDRYATITCKIKRHGNHPAHEFLCTPLCIGLRIQSTRFGPIRYGVVHGFRCWHVKKPFHRQGLGWHVNKPLHRQDLGSRIKLSGFRQWQQSRLRTRESGSGVQIPGSTQCSGCRIQIQGFRIRSEGMRI